MDLVHDRESNIEQEEEEEEDRISHLPDDIIHHILSSHDMKYVVHTSTLSRRWERIWTTTQHLNLNSRAFRTLPLFAKFVKHVLSHRSNHEDVCKVHLTLNGAAYPTVVKSIVNYAYQHNVRELNITWITRKFHQFPQCLFSSHTLKHLTLATSDQSFYLHKTSWIPKLAWDFPALETLFLSSMHFGDHGDESLDLFSKCVNLKDLTLHKCCLNGLQIFNIYAPELSNLTITDVTSFPDVFNVVAPQLKNLTASVRGTINRVPFIYDSLKLSTDGFISLENVNLSLKKPHVEQKRFGPLLVDLFHKFHRTRFLVINLDIIETLALCLDELSHEPCPFNNLKHVKIDTVLLNQRDCISSISSQVRDYLLENSPGATFIVESPQVTQKRSRQQVQDETMAKKVAKLDPEKVQPETLAQENRILEANVTHLSANTHFQSDVRTAELPPSPRPSSSFSQIPTPSSVAGSGRNNAVQL